MRSWSGRIFMREPPSSFPSGSAGFAVCAAPARRGAGRRIWQSTARDCQSGGSRNVSSAGGGSSGARGPAALTFAWISPRSRREGPRGRRTRPLTRRQREIYDFVRDFVGRAGLLAEPRGDRRPLRAVLGRDGPQARPAPRPRRATCARPGTARARSSPSRTCRRGRRRRCRCSGASRPGAPIEAIEERRAHRRAARAGAPARRDASCCACAATR